MANVLKKAGDKLVAGGRKAFNHHVLEQTKKYQKKYGFEIGEGAGATWNNQSDAFKHAYMQWALDYFGSSDIAKKLGDMHENETPNAPEGERNMDLWNNAIGREISYDMKNSKNGDYSILGEEMPWDIAAQKIVEKMNNGELITNPDDLRKFENMELERLSEKDRVYYNGEFSNFKEKVDAMVVEKYLDQVAGNNWDIPSKENLDKRVENGELIYIEKYTRADGSKVSGYYRRKPTR